jgi:hypothetical protein
VRSNRGRASDLIRIPRDEIIPVKNFMRACDTRLTLAPFILGLATVGIASAGDGSTSGTATALAQVKYAAPSTATVVLSLHAPDGGTARLVRVPGRGWTYGDAGLRKTSSATPTEPPQSVFIDGPTGYTFVYIQDAGWKFVGVVDSVGDGAGSPVTSASE